MGRLREAAVRLRILQTSALYFLDTYSLLSISSHSLDQPAPGRLDSFFQPLGGSAKADNGPAKRKAGAKAGPEPKKGKLGAIGKKK